MAATKSVALLLALAVSAQAALLRRKEKATCNPATKVCVAINTDAAGTPQWSCSGVADMAPVTLPPAATKFGAVICGPGSFSFSPMHCDGDKFDYKAVTVEIASSEWSGGACPGAGKSVSFPYSMACYKVDC